MLWGEISSMLTASQDHKHELERMRLQEEIDAAQHERNQAAIKLQADLKVEVIEVQGKVDAGLLDIKAFNSAVELTGKSTGINFVDAWNGMIRPALATESMLLIALDCLGYITMTENAWALTGAALGIYVADRTLFKRGK